MNHNKSSIPKKIKLLRITTVPISLHKLLQGQPQYMMQNGIDVILASAHGKEIREIEKNTGLKVHILPLTRKISPLTDLKALWQTYKLIKKEKANIVHTHTPKAGIVGMLAAKLAGVPIRMHTVAGLPLMQATGLKRKILNTVERLTAWSATGIYPNSRQLANFMVKEKLVPEKKLKVLAQGSSNGIDLDHFSPTHFSKEQNVALRKKLNINPTDFVFTFVGRLVGDKGINELVSAFTALQKKHTNIKLLLVGNEEPALDPLQENTRTTIQNNPDIITTGWVDDVRPYLAISDLFVFPSYREGMPNVVMQAGAMGLASIVTDINGSNEIIIHNQNGLIIPVKNKKALATAMETLLTNQELRQQLASQARPLIQNRFDQKLVWQALLKEYKHLAKTAGIIK